MCTVLRDTGKFFVAASGRFLLFNSLTLRLFYSSQYHFAGLSKCTLMVCFASVMSYQRPYVFQPSATTCSKTLPVGASGMCAVPSRLVFTFNSTFRSFFNLCSSTYFRYTLAFSTGLSFSPPETSMVTRDVGSAFPVCAFASGLWAVCARNDAAPPSKARAATHIVNSRESFILERNLPSTDCRRKSSASLGWMQTVYLTLPAARTICLQIFYRAD